MNQKYFFSDLDGTFIKEDMLLCSIKALLKESPHQMLFIFLEFWKGLPWIKDRIAAKIDIKKLDFSINQDVLALIKSKKKQGYFCCLISGSSNRIVKEVFSKSNIFDDYYGSDTKINLVGENKLRKIKQLTSDFEYIGNSEQDIPIWQNAEKAYICSRSKKLVERVVSLFPEVTKIKAD